MGVKVALVHECIAGYHGSERVLAVLAGLYPEAVIFATACEKGALVGTPLAGREVRTTWLDGVLRVPGLGGRHRLMLPLMPHAVETHDLRGFDVVISSHHAVAHGVLTRADQLHLCYTHSPARYAWDLVHEHVPPGRAAPIKRCVLHRFRQWDQLAGRRVDGFAANSNVVARRIAKTYGKTARVIHPPVDTERFDPTQSRDDFYVMLGRLVPYKRPDVVVAAFNKLGKRLVVVGDGPMMKALRRMAGPNVELAGELSEAEVADRLQRCRAMVFAAEEDFGMAPVEAMAAGAPVIAFNRGGALETVIEGQSGCLFGRSTGRSPGKTSGEALKGQTAGLNPDDVVEAVRRFEAQGVTLDAGQLHLQARRFGIEPFHHAVVDWVDTAFRLHEASCEGGPAQAACLNEPE